MSGDDGRSRERLVDPRVFERLGEDRGLWHEGEEGPEPGGDWSDIVDSLRELVATRLTRRQQQIVELYFYEGRTQEEIAAQLGISQQVVSRQLFGVLRKGRKVGGAIRKLQKILEQQGIGVGREDKE